MNRELEMVVANVLILVLMEDTLRAAELWLRLSHYSLNPCFNGRYSQSIAGFVLAIDYPMS